MSRRVAVLYSIRASVGLRSVMTKNTLVRQDPKLTEDLSETMGVEQLTAFKHRLETKWLPEIDAVEAQVSNEDRRG
jgi:hypothetical protein